MNAEYTDVKATGASTVGCAEPRFGPAPDPRRVPGSLADRLMDTFRLPGLSAGERSYGLDALQDRTHPDHPAAARALFAALGAEIHPGVDTTTRLQIYPLRKAFGVTRQGVERTLDRWLAKIGWSYRIFGPDEHGRGWTDPDFRTASYHTKSVWIYQPADPNGSFRNYAYTLAWRVTHEIAHALVNDDLTARYGLVGRRLGRLGQKKTYRAKGRFEIVTAPLTLADALRAIEWEQRTFPRQRMVLETEFGVRISDEDFARENLVNMADAIYRMLTGHFSSPGDLGVMPRPADPEEVFERSSDLLWLAARELGLVTLQGSGMGLRHRCVSIPLPVADNAGVRFPRGAVRWFESALRKLAGGFRKYPRVLGSWEKDGGPCDERVVVYEATVDAGQLGEFVALAKEAHRVFRQKTILLEVSGVEKILIGGGGEVVQAAETAADDSVQ